MLTKTKKIEETLDIHSRNLLNLNSALLTLQETHSTTVTALLSKLLEDEKFITEAVVSLQAQIKILNERLNKFEEIMVEQGKVARITETVDPKDRN
jgi:hypothetical protein